jgi:hypothetical protein
MKAMGKFDLDAKCAHFTIISPKLKTKKKIKEPSIMAWQLDDEKGTSWIIITIIIIIIVNCRTTSRLVHSLHEFLSQASWWIHGFDFYVKPMFLLGLKLNIWAENTLFFFLHTKFKIRLQSVFFLVRHNKFSCN